MKLKFQKNSQKNQKKSDTVTNENDKEMAKEYICLQKEDRKLFIIKNQF